MRSTDLGNAFLSISIVFAFTSILFSNISFAILGVAFATSYVYSYLRFVRELERTDLHIERNILDEMAFMMEPVSITVEVLNRDPIPIRGTFEDLIPDDCVLSAGSNRATMTLPPRTLLKLSYSVIPQKRGTHNIRGMKIDRTDSLGLLSEEQIIEHGSVVNVHTEKRILETARAMAGKEHLEFSGIGRNPAIVLREFEFDGIREYIPGDRARDIHWKLLPKLNKLMTKTYRKEGALRTTIFVDCGRSMRLETGKVAKMNHALDISIQLSNVLISSFHPVGVATFDELRVIGKVPPALGKHQFDRIVKALADVPRTIKDTTPGQVQRGQIDSSKTNPTKPASVQNAGGKNTFLSSLEKLSPGGQKNLGIGLEGGVKETLARNKGQEQLFIVISDLISSRNAVLASAKICRATGNRMLVIHTYDDWYRNQGQVLEVKDAEGLYSNLNESIKLEAALRGSRASYIRIGPADAAPRITRAIRRGKT